MNITWTKADQDTLNHHLMLDKEASTHQRIIGYGTLDGPYIYTSAFPSTQEETYVNAVNDMVLFTSEEVYDGMLCNIFVEDYDETKTYTINLFDMMIIESIIEGMGPNL